MSKWKVIFRSIHLSRGTSYWAHTYFKRFVLPKHSIWVMPFPRVHTFLKYAHAIVLWGYDYATSWKDNLTRTTCVAIWLSVSVIKRECSKLYLELLRFHWNWLYFRSRSQHPPLTLALEQIKGKNTLHWKELFLNAKHN